MTNPMEILRYFVGKYCTVCTEPTGLKLTHEASINYFSGIIEHLDEVGIVMRHQLTNNKSYFLMNRVIGIVEEQALDPRNPEHAEIIKQYKKLSEVKNEGGSTVPVNPFEEKTQGSPWINPTQIAEMAQKPKKLIVRTNKLSYIMTICTRN